MTKIAPCLAAPALAIAQGKLTYYCTIHGKVQSGTVTVTR